MVKNLSDKNMLLLEDNEEFIHNALNMFSLFVKNVFIVHTIGEAKSLLSENKIDFIFTDIHLKNENGLDFIHDIRQTNQHIPIVILSGHKDEEFLFRAMVLNLSGYLLKPINFKDLINALENCAQKLEMNNQTTVLLKNGYYYDKTLKYITHEENKFELNKKEILFFDMVVSHKNHILTREMFEAYVWNYEEMSDSALNNFIMRIRRRFGKDFLHTIPNVGYKIIL